MYQVNIFAAICFSAILNSCLAYHYDEDPNVGSWKPNCPAWRPHRRLGMCYHSYEQPQVASDVESTLPTGHTFIIFGKSRSYHSYYGSHISVFKLHPHIYSATVEIKLLNLECRLHVNEILKLIENENQNLLFQYNDTAIKIVDLVNSKTPFHIQVQQTFTTDHPASMRCKAKMEGVVDLRRYHQTTPQPAFPPDAHWVIFGHYSHDRDDNPFQYYMENIPLKCEDIHQGLEVTVSPIPGSFYIPQFEFGSGSVIVLKGIPGDPSLNNAGIPQNHIVLGHRYEAVTLERSQFTGRHHRFNVHVKRKVFADVAIINIGCP